MSDVALGRRIFHEHRRVVLTMAVALVVNVLVYVLAVQPLSARVANITERDVVAERALASARKEHEAATGVQTGKDRASQELARFYADVLPRDLAAARRLIQRVPQMARQFNVDFYSSTVAPPSRARESTLTRYSSKVELAGRYRDVRMFIHGLETAPQFVVIDDVSLSEEDDESGIVQLTLQLSTYYQAAE